MKARAWLIVPLDGPGSGGRPRRAPEAQIAEAESLVCALARAKGLLQAGTTAFTLSAKQPGTFFGKGRLQQTGHEIAQAQAQIVIVDAAVTPVQQRNLERLWNVKLLDRTGMILEIFAARARSREGRLQVDLARFEYQKSRLVRSWTHLERQRGGLGKVGGPGERQIESDRRLLAGRIGTLRRRIAQIKGTRALHRRARARVPWPIIAIVGYTNAGKSTLFNRLTGAEVLARDMPFATLDPTMRAVDLGEGVRGIFSDTVGFITDLPAQLVAAFQATLEDVREADAIVHVRDVSHPESAAQKANVLSVLHEIGVSRDPLETMIEACNKIDRVDAADRGAVRRACAARGAIVTSARSGEGMAALQCAVRERLVGRRCHVRIALDAADGAALAWLYRHGAIARRTEKGNRIHLDARLDEAALGAFRRHFAPLSPNMRVETGISLKPGFVSGTR